LGIPGTSCDAHCVHAGLIPTPTQGQLEGCIQALLETLGDIIDHSQRSGLAADEGDAAHAAPPPSALDVQSVRVMGASEGAYALLLLLRRWAAEAPAGEGARLELGRRLLDLTRCIIEECMCCGSKR
jgi:hypothetical protein